MIIIISFLLISVGVALLPHLVYLVAKIISLIAHFHVAYKPFGYTALGLVGLWLILFCWGYFFGRYFHEVKPVTIACKGLPKAYDGFRIVQISDLHLDGWVGHEDELLGIVNEINALKPDAIVFTGDLVSLDESELKPFIPILSKLKSPNGVVSIMGNHDYLPYNRSLSDKERAYKISDLQRMQREDLGWSSLRTMISLIPLSAPSAPIPIVIFPFSNRLPPSGGRGEGSLSFPSSAARINPWASITSLLVAT